MTYEEFKDRKLKVLATNRAHNELVLKQWLDYYKTLPQSIKTKFPIDENLTYETACPEAYKANPDQAIYNQQQAALDAMFEPINNFAVENNRRVDALLQEAEKELRSN